MSKTVENCNILKHVKYFNKQNTFNSFKRKYALLKEISKYLIKIEIFHFFNELFQQEIFPRNSQLISNDLEQIIKIFFSLFFWEFNGSFDSNGEFYW